MAITENMRKGKLTLSGVLSQYLTGDFKDKVFITVTAELESIKTPTVELSGDTLLVRNAVTDDSNITYTLKWRDEDGNEGSSILSSSVE